MPPLPHQRIYTFSGIALSAPTCLLLYTPVRFLPLLRILPGVCVPQCPHSSVSLQNICARSALSPDVFPASPFHGSGAYQSGRENSCSLDGFLCRSQLRSRAECPASPSGILYVIVRSIFHTLPFHFPHAYNDSKWQRTSPQSAALNIDVFLHLF